MRCSSIPHTLSFLLYLTVIAVAKEGTGITTNPLIASSKSFDYIICGGGLTGLTVASRLTEDPNTTVLVIEAGYDNHDDPRVNDVRTYGEAFGTELDHNLTSTPVSWQKGAKLPLVAGKTLGGSDSINGASWTKGTKEQYDLLAELSGDESWGWKEFNPLMLRAEHFNYPEPAEIDDGAEFEETAHGFTGPVQVSFPYGIFGGIQQPALSAAEKVWPGMRRVADAASGVVNGDTVVPNMVLSDESQNRSSAFTAYALRQVHERENFHILTGHRVTEIVWKENGDMAAEGVRFQACRECEVHMAHASREVLLAAGSLQSPQLLELSGVGDGDVLAAADVPLKMSAPGVGKHMQEQTKNTLIHTPESTEFGGTGPPSAIAFPNVRQILGSNASAVHTEILDTLPAYVSDLETRGMVSNGTATLPILEAQIGNLFIDDAPAAEIFFVTSPRTGRVGIDLWNLITLSRGSVHIRTNCTWDHPIVEPSYFGHPYDLMIQTAASMQSRQVYQTEPLASLIHQEEIPGNDVPRDAEYDVWEQWVKTTFTSVWHYISTLAMMKEELGGVVDSRLRVYGIENVRVIDASVLPIQLSAHLSSSLYGIAEKAAVMIREDQARV